MAIEVNFYIEGWWIKTIEVTRWFMFTLKPPQMMVISNFSSAIWDTSLWKFLVKFGHRHFQTHPGSSFGHLQGHLSILQENTPS